MWKMTSLALCLVSSQLVLLLSGVASGCQGPITAPDLAGHETCADISSDIDCRGFYQSSFFPNNIATNPGDATNVVDFYLRRTATGQNCSRYLHLYVCLAARPLCLQQNSTSDSDGGKLQVRLPCRDFCWRVAADCQDSVSDIRCLYDCNRWPDTDNCISIEDPLVTTHVTPDPTVDPDTSGGPPEPSPSPTALQDNSSSSSATCPPEAQTFFTAEAKRFAKGWIAFWSVVCFLSTLVTLLTFLLDTSRFQYPWRPIIYLALSFLVHTLGYFLALIIGPASVTCPGGNYVETDGRWTWNHTPCIMVFGLLYYSMIAAFLWWLILTLSWFLSSAYKWTNEAISQFAVFYHTAAWVIPLILTISVLAARVVSADELTGTCFLVRSEAETSFLAMLFGIILPLSLFLLVGSIFLCIGLFSVLKIRRFMVNRGKERESIILEKLMLRIGVYVAIYVIPATVLIGCFIYEIDSQPGWHPVGDPCTNCSRPNTAVFMVRVFMFLLTGALTGAWIWSRKTLQSWRKLPEKLRGCVFPPTSDQRTEEPEKLSATRLGSFTTGPQPQHQPVRITPSYPYSVESGAEFSA